MSKIADFEKQIIKNGMTDADFEEYKVLLKRVQGNFLKRQHCYTTAIQFAPKHAKQAIKLIEYGLETFPDTWFSTYTSYLFMGKIYESIQEYQKAYDLYLKAKESLDGNGEENEKELEGDLCWMLLHINSFEYSEELEEHYMRFEKLNEFAMAELNNEFRSAIIRLVILLHQNKSEEAKEVYKQVKEMCAPNYVGKLHDIYARHNYKENLKITPETKKFLQGLKFKWICKSLL